ncbi:Uncharacterised protein [Mycobacteroides abscessus]|nr:Uncharacterised protein [Mycobacteroides abscessus]
MRVLDEVLAEGLRAPLVTARLDVARDLAGHCVERGQCRGRLLAGGDVGLELVDLAHLGIEVGLLFRGQCPVLTLGLLGHLTRRLDQRCELFLGIHPMCPFQASLIANSAR